MSERLAARKAGGASFLADEIHTLREQVEALLDEERELSAAWERAVCKWPVIDSDWMNKISVN
ncbi:hypothetical protein ACTQV0_00120 [Selenomonas montiformis]|uniref:Uncharacterized protein n=1 Tax=Selenomonas montiformis TaxID=2652285 RepID=A0A6I2UXR7_9FIRM|nr:hypothetical protein [Selenomonas montiformis]MDY4696427.1 hypothetical protein [Selenomonas montiformis]MSV25199.1 hypothetical protein [Selenomonas montiformis]